MVKIISLLLGVLLLLLNIWIPKAEAQTPTPTIFSSTFVTSCNCSMVDWQAHNINALVQLGSLTYSSPAFVTSEANGVVLYPEQGFWIEIYNNTGTKLSSNFIDTPYTIDLLPEEYLVALKGVGFEYRISMPLPASTPTPTPNSLTITPLPTLAAVDFADMMTNLPDLSSQAGALWEPDSDYGYLFLSLAGFFLFVFVGMFVRSMAWRAD